MTEIEELPKRLAGPCRSYGRAEQFIPSTLMTRTRCYDWEWGRPRGRNGARRNSFCHQASGAQNAFETRTTSGSPRLAAATRRRRAVTRDNPGNRLLASSAVRSASFGMQPL